VNTSLDVEIREEIERPLADVWAMVSDATRLPQWLGEFEHVVQESEGPVGKGTVFRYTLSPGPGERSALLEWVDWQPERRLTWDGPPWRPAARIVRVERPRSDKDAVDQPLPAATYGSARVHAPPRGAIPEEAANHRDPTPQAHP
jgi:uncharacterized protein YndB with AHSA1/START domain